MNDLEAIQARHSVRSYTSEPIDAQTRAALTQVIERGNAEGGLHLQLVCDDPEAFDSAMVHYGRFSGVRNYVVAAGPDSDTLEERCGYYGERVALRAQELGLNSCWVALTFKRRYVKKMLAPGDKLVVVIALGHGTTAGIARKSKKPADVTHSLDNAPAWFRRGIDAALLAPTAMNQQSFQIDLAGTAPDGTPLVSAQSKGGAYSRTDLGIAKLHFEIGAGADTFAWA